MRDVDLGAGGGISGVGSGGVEVLTLAVSSSRTSNLFAGCDRVVFGVWGDVGANTGPPRLCTRGRGGCAAAGCGKWFTAAV